MKKICIIRVDGNKLIGHGHLRRCLAISESLYQDCDLYIATNKISEEIKKEFLNYRIKFLLLKNRFKSSQKESEYILNKIKNLDIIIFDGYHFNTANKKIFKNNNIKIISIDDEGKNDLLSDRIINHAPNISSKKFKGISKTKLKLGTRYLMVQNCFFKNKRSINSYKKIENNIFICLGSSSNANRFVEKIINILFLDERVDKIFLIYSKNIKEKISFNNVNKRKLRVFSGLPAIKMAKLMTQSKIGICTSSTVALECCAINMPLIVGYLVNNQKNIYDGLINAKMACGIGKLKNSNIQKIKLQVNNLLNKVKVRENMIKYQNKNIDYLSHNRIRNTILKK